MTNSTGIKIISPATLRFDSFGMENLSMTLENPANELIAKLDTETKNITLKDTSLKKIENPELLISFGNEFIDQYGIENGAIININNRIPALSGLGNIESNITALALALNELNKIHLDKNSIFRLIEKYTYDNNSQLNLSAIASNLFGGCIAYNQNIKSSIQKIYEPNGLAFSIFSFTTSFASINDKSECNSSDIVTFIKAMMTSDVSLLKEFFHNNSLQKQWTKEGLYSEIRALAIEHDAMGIGFTDNHKSIFIISENTVIRENVDSVITKYIKKTPLKYQYFSSGLNLNGLYKS
ncbi:MAG: hypothetical protein R2771_09425 [Saprospiraceae bacterium]